jgi:hypothetical protein
VYFNAVIDTLFLREYQTIGFFPRSLTRQQALLFIWLLLDKHEIQKLMLTLDTAVQADLCSENCPPNIFQFPNLKEVTFVKQVRSDVELPCTVNSWAEKVGFYWVRDCINYSAAPHGFTHFLDKDEIERLAPVHKDMQNSCPEYPRSSFKTQTDDDKWYINNLIGELRAGAWGDKDWNQPLIHFKGVSYNRITPGRMYHKRWGSKIYKTRSLSAQMARNESDGTPGDVDKMRP